MWHKWVFLLLVSAWVIVPFPVQADDTAPVYALSGRYSIEVPSGWVVDLMPAGSDQFPGEELVIASSADVLAARGNYPQLDDGALIDIDFYPVNVYNNYFNFEPSAPDDLAGKTGDELLETLNVRGVKMQIGGYPARRFRERSWDEAGHLTVRGETLVSVDYFIYRIYYMGPEMAELEAIVDTLQFYTEAAAAVDLMLEDATFSRDVGWLTARWGFGAPFNSRMVLTDETSMGYYYVILTEKFADFFSLLYPPPLENGMVPYTTSAELPGLYVMVGVHPYDQLFGSADVPVDQSRRESAFNEILSALSANAEGSPELAVVDGVPALTATLDLVFRKPNHGQLTVVDANYIFYSILVAGAADEWDQMRADEMLARFHIALPEPVAAGEIGTGAQVGLHAPDFTLSLVDGSTVSLSDYQGKVVLLNFWASWCEPCVEEMDEFQAYYVEHSDEAVILAVDYRESADIVTQFVAENELTFPVALDLDGTVADLYRINHYPTNMIIDAEGIIHAIPLEPMDSVRVIEGWINAAQQD